jgi:hypothetical protein
MKERMRKTKIGITCKLTIHGPAPLIRVTIPDHPSDSQWYLIVVPIAAEFSPKPQCAIEVDNCSPKM